jgi:predicted RNA-binding protein with TRAM domain
MLLRIKPSPFFNVNIVDAGSAGGGVTDKAGFSVLLEKAALK